MDASVIEKEIETQKLHWFAHMAEEILVLRQMIPAGRPKVLDFGCNWGKWASMALAFGCDVDAVEVNSVTAEFCSSRGIKVIDPETLEDNHYDFINVDQVLEHIADPLDVARKLADKLAPGGFMKWSTPQNEKLPGALLRAADVMDGTILQSANIDALEPLFHINLFTNKALRELGRKAGMEVVSQPLLTWLGAGQMWNLPRQIGRNLSVPRKRWLGQGTYLWFSRTAPHK
jgi:SAM-dependent methyltransferase